MGCVVSFRQLQRGITRQAMYALPPDAPLGSLCEFLRKVFPTDNGDKEEEKEEELFVRRRRTVREQLADEEAKYRAGLAMFNEFERDLSSDESDNKYDEEEEEEEGWWEEVTSSDDRSRD